ncbi:hypothetical protein IW261DRAFT_481634 [Armillaria novae-zelandiae]|uniref:Uncharacterized protein n=1 Tax=Armillaria novae-zelandiae TaxID=153914 RepID=A0AA39P0V7_9AGAR|nr:hypothetical protein IW261DRAFT_481634 [Armillaria novae-zelandiae]
MQARRVSTADAADPFPDLLPPAALPARVHLLRGVRRGRAEALDGRKRDVAVYEAALQRSGPGVEFLLLLLLLRGCVRRVVPRGQKGVLRRGGAHGHGAAGERRGGAPRGRRRRGEEEGALGGEGVSGGGVSASVVAHLAQDALEAGAQDLLVGREVVRGLARGDGGRVAAAVLAGRGRRGAVGQHVAQEALGLGRGGRGRRGGHAGRCGGNSQGGAGFIKPSHSLFN